MNPLANTLFEITIYSGVILGCLALFKKVFRSRLSPSLHLALWLILIARLAIPATVESDVRLIQVPAAPLTDAARETRVPAFEAADPALPETPELEPRGAGSSESVPAPAPSAQPLSQPRQAPRPLAAWEWTLIAWLAGVLLSLGLVFRSYRTLRRTVLSSSLSVPDHVARLTEECRRELGIRSFVPVVAARGAQSPSLLFPGIILLPEHALSMDDERLRMALRHELTHLRRGDAWKALGLALLRSVYWFNPFVWIAIPMIREDMETACDAQVTKGWNRARVSAYAATVLSMFGSAPGPAAALAMASEGARRNAERRIRGIYMKKTSRLGAKGGALALAGVLAVGCFTTVCRPAAAARVVVSGESRIARSAADPEPRQVPYSVSERWTQTLTPLKGLTIEANADVLTPDADALPISEVERLPLPQETVDALVARLVPEGATAYQMPAPIVKGEYEKRLAQMRDRLQIARERGESAEEINAASQAVLELEEAAAAAPEENRLQPAGFDYTYDVDYETGLPDTSLGKNYVHVAGAGPDGVNFSVSACRVSDSMGRDPFFEFVQGGYSMEEADRRSLASLELSLNGDLSSEESLKAGGDEAYLESLRGKIARYEGNSIDVEAVKSRAVELVESLGISGLEILDAQRALFWPETSPLEDGVAFMIDETGERPEDAVLVTLTRGSGGLPCVTHEENYYEEDQAADVYCAPFSPESVHVLITEDGSVRLFQWYAPSRVCEAVSEDAEVLPFSEVKGALTGRLAEQYAPWIDFEGATYTVRVDSARLVMTYVDSENASDRARLVPAWLASGVVTEASPGAPEYRDSVEMMVCALDGKTILCPGIVETAGKDRG